MKKRLWIGGFNGSLQCYGRARRIKEVWDFIENMPIGLGITVYGATLGACNIHKNVESGESR